ncbi:MAG: ATP-binding protein [Clostridiales bacterium]|nr:ATP-binding protein [Clostridiales bacterium]MCF8021955.1 ATP-binding protein [Clostridiales bacterium]
MSEYICNICKDRGVIIQGNTAVPCSCQKKKAIYNCFKNSRLPNALTDNTFNNFNLKYYSKEKHDNIKNVSYLQLAEYAYQASQNFVHKFLNNEEVEGILFTGQIGSGKTFLACCIANYLLNKEKTVLFMVVPDLLDMLRATYTSQKGDITYTEQDLLCTARGVPLLILDDLGVHNYTEWTKNKIYSIINYRLNNNLPTIITTNISLEDLEEYLGERTTSRILQMCKPYRLLVDIDIRFLKRKDILSK